MRDWLKKYPIHTLLILPYLAFFLYAKNAHILNIEMIIRPLLFSIFVSLIVLFSAYFLFSKKLLKAGIWSSFVLFLFANYGFIYDYIEQIYYAGYWPFSNIHRYLVLSYIIIIILAYFVVRISHYYFYNLTQWLNMLIPSLILFNVLFIIVNPYYKKRNDKECNNTIILQTNRPKPDVYYFILDGFSNFNALRNFYKYENDTFHKFLIDKGFFIAKNSYANYYYTSSSLPATLNMNYLSNNSLKSIKDNLVFRVFKSLGYTIYTVNSGYTVSNQFICADIDLNKEIINDYERAILKNTIFRLDDLVGIIPYFRIKQQLSFLKNIDSSYPSPKFIFAHIVCPHPPYVFDKNGKLKPTNSFSDKTWEPKESYLEQLEYISKEMMKTTEIILNNYNNSNIKPIIIIQSDHGPYFSHKNPEIVKYCRTHILNAMFLQNKDSLYHNISAINTFRYIFKYELGLNINLIKDSMAGLEELEKNRNYINLYN